MARPISLKRIATRILKVVALAYVAIAVLLYLMQGSITYHPSPLQFEPDAQALTVAGRTGPLRGWVVNPGKPEAVVYFGGNGERLEYDVDMFRALLPDRSVYLVPFRGYGPNKGTPSEPGIEADALAVFDFAHSQHAKIAVVGRSLGTGVATYVAAHRPVERLVLVTPYDSILNIARDRYGIFPVSWMLRDRYESWRNADSIKAPTLVLLASNDNAVPRANSDALIAHFGTRPGIVVIEHADHNNLSNSPFYREAIQDFLDADARLSPRPSSGPGAEPAPQPTSPPAPPR